MNNKKVLYIYLATETLGRKSGPITRVIVIQNPCGLSIATAMTPGVSCFTYWFTIIIPKAPQTFTHIFPGLPVCLSILLPPFPSDYKYLFSSSVNVDLANLINGTWDEASNVLVFSKGFRKGCAEGRCCLHCWKAYFTCSNQQYTA